MAELTSVTTMKIKFINMKIDKIANGAEYRINEKFQN